MLRTCAAKKASVWSAWLLWGLLEQLNEEERKERGTMPGDAPGSSGVDKRLDS